MAVATRHVLSQGKVLRALAGVALGGLRPSGKPSPASVPGPWIQAELPPLPPRLVADFVASQGGTLAVHGGNLPASLFPQWALPLAARAMAPLPYRLSRALNGGCRIVQRQPLPAGERLLVRARLESVDDDGKRALITQTVITGTRSAPDALTTELRAYVPLAKRKDAAPRQPALVPARARELAFFAVPADAGLDFAKLTGDFNPIHWIPRAGRAAGFGGCILHGFSTLARALEVVDRELLGGQPARLAIIDARFTRPLPLPARVGVYAHDGQLWVGDGPGGLAYLEARLETNPS